MAEYALRNYKPPPAPSEPGGDQPVVETDPLSLTVIQEVLRCRNEAEDAKWSRLRKTYKNREAYFGRQNWGGKQDGQSTEFLPKTSLAVEQMCNFVKRGLIKFGEWYSVEVGEEMSEIIDGNQLRSILNVFLNDLWTANNSSSSLPILISDAIKAGLLESTMIVKVHGGMRPLRRYKYQREGTTVRNVKHVLQMEEDESWKLRIDLVRQEDYYPDPTGNGLYEIHTVERDLHEIIKGAEDGLYDKKAVDQLIGVDFKRPEDEKMPEAARNQNEVIHPAFRKRVLLHEFWGTLLDRDGQIAHENCVCTVANNRFLIRPPEDNPFWHQESPFVVAPIIRVPHSVWHKALYDDAVDLNLAQNELFNLILDGSMAAVWGVKQVRLEDLEDPSQVEGGIRQGMTLAVKQTLPHNAKVVEECTTGNVPNDAMAVYEAVDREFTQAVLTNELKLGSLPSKQVRATEVVEASQSQGAMLDGICADIETGFIDTILYKSWLTVLQNADDLDDGIMDSVTDRAVANMIMRASPEERYALFAGKSKFRVFGLSATMARALDYQKILALLQAVQLNPMLFQAFMLRFSPEKTLRTLMHKLNINPDDWSKDQEELAKAAEEMQRTQAASQMLGQAAGQAPAQASAPGAGGPGGEGGAPLGGGSQVPAEVNQLTNPQTGLTPNA